MLIYFEILKLKSADPKKSHFSTGAIPSKRLNTNRDWRGSMNMITIYYGKNKSVWSLNTFMIVRSPAARKEEREERRGRSEVIDYRGTELVK